ncbi:uncharacterized protein LOC109608288 [Aethina tumida]|uniref:uncharacterized protein LOC109608288 n=1 Tax=Aethina tumida TaxID=116153 RepID=UPI0021491FC2|nr:uncharacterized protein LOC109608288 [Aethina tumida]
MMDRRYSCGGRLNSMGRGDCGFGRGSGPSRRRGSLSRSQSVKYWRYLYDGDSDKSQHGSSTVAQMGEFGEGDQFRNDCMPVNFNAPPRYFPETLPLRRTKSMYQMNVAPPEFPGSHAGYVAPLPSPDMSPIPEEDTTDPGVMLQNLSLNDRPSTSDAYTTNVAMPHTDRWLKHLLTTSITKNEKFPKEDAFDPEKDKENDWHMM